MRVYVLTGILFLALGSAVLAQSAGGQGPWGPRSYLTVGAADSRYVNATGDAASDLNCSGDCVSPAEIAQGTAGQILSSNATPDTAWCTPSGDLTMSNTCAFTLANSGVTAGSCTSCDLTVNAKGQVTAQTSTPVPVYFLLTDPASDITTANNVAYWRVPSKYNGWKIRASPHGVAAHVSTVSSSGTPTFTITKCTAASSYGTCVAVLSTAETIDANENDSSTAATPGVVNASNNTLATADRVEINITVAGTGAKGAAIELTVVAP